MLEVNRDTGISGVLYALIELYNSVPVVVHTLVVPAPHVSALCRRFDFCIVVQPYFRFFFFFFELIFSSNL